MPKITRSTQKIFASNASNNGVFGSARAGTKILSNVISTLMSLPAYLNGWADATVSGDKLPTLEEMQALNYINTSQLAYIFQEGIPEYDSGTTYYQKSIVKKTGTYELYGSITDNNINNALPASGASNANWKFLTDLSLSPNVFGTGGGTANAQTLTLTPPLTGLVDGQLVAFYPTVSNTTAACTLNVDSTGNKAIKLRGQDPPIGAVASGLLFAARYKLATQTWEIENALGELSAQSRNLSIGLNENMTTVASATTPDIWTGTGNVINYTGTTTSTGFAAAPQAGARRMLICAGVSTFTNGANMIIDGGANFTSAAGDRIYVTAITTTQFRLEPVKADGTPVAGAASVLSMAKYMHVRSQFASGTNGGSCTTVTWNPRPLNTVITNNISGASLGSNRVTLPAGTYYIRATGVTCVIGSHSMRLRNITDGATVPNLIGTVGNTGVSADNQNVVTLNGYFTIAGSKVLELQHYTSNTRSGNGLGNAAAAGEVENYSDFEIWQVS